MPGVSVEKKPAARAPTARVVLPRSHRYSLSEEEQAAYRRFVDMLSQLDKASRLQLAETAVKEGSLRASQRATDGPSGS